MIKKLLNDGALYKILNNTNVPVKHLICCFSESVFPV